jgi:rhamnosyltransferase
MAIQPPINTTTPKIAAAVILYQQDDLLLNNIESYANAVNYVFVFDNNEVPNTTLHQKLQQTLANKLVLTVYHTNNGIAKPLNNALALAQQYNCNLLLTMDQDSYITNPEKITEYGNYILQNTTIGTLALSYYFFKRGKAFKNHADICWRKKGVITSGSLVNVQHALQCGGYNEALFIDEVDYEFCLRLTQNNFAVLTSKQQYVNHQLGTTTQLTSNRTGKTSSIAVRSPIRTYYMVRNNKYLFNKYKFTFSTLRFAFKRYKNIRFLYNQINQYYTPKQKAAHLQMFAKGIAHAKQGKMGKYQG